MPSGLHARAEGLRVEREQLVGEGVGRRPHHRHGAPGQGQPGEHTVGAEPLEGHPVIGALADEVRHHTALAVRLDRGLDPGTFAHPGVAPVRTDHQRGLQAAAVVEAQRSHVRIDLQRSRRRRAEQRDVVLALEALPDLHVHQAGLADPGQLLEAAVVGREHELSTGVAVNTHLGDRAESVMVEMRPHAELVEEARARRTIGVDARIPARGTTRRGMLDHGDAQRTAPQRHRQRRTGEAAADDDEIEFHDHSRHFSTARNCARGRTSPSRLPCVSCCVPVSGGVSGVDWFAVRRGVSFLGEGFYGT